MISLYDLINGWNYFFFHPEPASTIGLVRILIGLCSFLNALWLVSKCHWYFGPEGFFGSKFIKNSIYDTERLNIFRYLPKSVKYVYLVMILLLLFSLSLMVGWHTRLSAIVVYILTTSLNHRNLYMFHSGDTVLRILLFLLMFSRAGDGLSMDCYLSGKDMLYTMGEPWVERLMMIQVCTVYAYTGWLKICSEPWVNGSASFYPLFLDSYKNFRVPNFLKTTPWVQIATWLTLLIEEMNAFTIWIKELRYVSLVSGILLHCVFAYCLRLELFGFVMICGALLFIRPEDLSRWLEELCRIIGL
jgi:hypothetical protein